MLIIMCGLCIRGEIESLSATRHANPLVVGFSAQWRPYFVMLNKLYVSVLLLNNVHEFSLTIYLRILIDFNCATRITIAVNLDEHFTCHWKYEFMKKRRKKTPNLYRDKLHHATKLALQSQWEPEQRKRLDKFVLEIDSELPSTKINLLLI